MRHSRTTKRNPKVKDWSRKYKRKGNVQFFADAAAALRQDGKSGRIMMGLLGQRDIPGHTLRTAQAVLRWDARPGLWSHVFLFAEDVPAKATAAGKSTVLEIPLWPRTGQFPRPECNGVGEATLDHYDNPQVDANVALLSMEMSARDVKSVRDRARDYNFDRVRYDLWEALGVWHGYLWSHGQRPNPLREDVPIPSTSYLEMVFEAINVDLTPMANTRNSAPEHLWNAAVWWHQVFKELKHPISGCYVLRDKGCSLLGTDD